jgi:hypothetical protein
MQTLEQPKLENITLYYREGTSDKVYQCQIEQAGERFVVNFAYGRRGSTMNTGTKTNVPVEYADAKRIFDKLVKEKMAIQRVMAGDVVVGCEYKTTGAAGWITNRLSWLRCQHFYHRCREWARCEVLARAAFHVLGVLLQQPFPLPGPARITQLPGDS